VRAPPTKTRLHPLPICRWVAHLNSLREREHHVDQPTVHQSTHLHQESPNSPSTTPPMNARHSTGLNTCTGPWRSFESRTATLLSSRTRPPHSRSGRSGAHTARADLGVVPAGRRGHSSPSAARRGRRAPDWCGSPWPPLSKLATSPSGAQEQFQCQRELPRVACEPLKRSAAPLQHSDRSRTRPHPLRMGRVRGRDQSRGCGPPSHEGHS